MKEPSEIALPLYEVFLQLKEKEKVLQHKSIDLTSYLQLVGFLQKGYMLNSFDELLFLCEKLWLKPYHNTGSVLNHEILKKVLLESLNKHGAIQITEKPGDVLDKQVVKNRKERTGKAGEAADVNHTGQDDRVEKDLSSNENNAGTSEIEKSTVNIGMYLDERPDAELNKRLHQENISDKFMKKPFIVKGKYLLVSSRKIEQTIRSFRDRKKNTGRAVIDMQATIQRIAKYGFFDRLMVKEIVSFTTNWTILIDHEGSMVAFQSLSEEIASIATKELVGNKGDIYYFKNYPLNFLYNNDKHTRSISFRQFCAKPKMNILIISDAGAARGSYSEDRVRATVNALNKMSRHRVAWLNPLPKERWKSTSAEMISGFTDMFEIGNTGNDLSNIVRLFKSKLLSGGF